MTTLNANGIERAVKAYENACKLRDEAMEEMSRCARDPELVADGFDPGDATIDIGGNPKNILAVLYLLNAIGIPGCRAR